MCQYHCYYRKKGIKTNGLNYPGHAVPGGLWAAASASFSIFKQAACKAFPSPCTFVPVWTCRSHSYGNARATETSFPSGEDWLRYVLWHSTALWGNFSNSLSSVKTLGASNFAKPPVLGAFFKLLSTYYEVTSTCYVINVLWRSFNMLSTYYEDTSTCYQLDTVVSRTWPSGRWIEVDVETQS
jgi:hypothetical protein